MDDWFKKCFLKDMIVLGIESSCDETAASVVTDKREILSNVILSQIEEHKIFGGVVPEIAARAHLEYIDNVVETAVKKAGISFADIDAVAGASGPGLIGGVLVGVMTSKAIASVLNKPYIAVNHLEGHALTARLTGDVEFPYLLLLVSGGHCQLLAVEGVGKYRQLGATIDDAAGEAFDKVAKMLKAGYPGGQSVEKLAINGDPKRFSFPRPLKNREGCDFSFSGLKTSVRRKIESMSDEPLASIVLNEQDKARKRMAAAIRGGVKFAVGTDGMHGGLAQEIEYLVELGAPASEALMAATRYAALVCGLEESIGTLEPDKAADIIGVKGNPLEDIRVLGRVGTVISKGKVKCSPSSPAGFL